MACRRLAPALVVVAALLALASRSYAGCGAEGCPVDLRGPEVGRARFSFDLSYQYLDQDQPRIGTRRAEVGEIPGVHNEIETRTRSWIATARGGVGSWLAFSASLPYIDRLHVHEHEHHPGFYEEQEWNYAGLGDLMVVGNVTPGGSAPSHPTSVTFQLGVKAPTGKRNVETIDGGQPEPMARPGTGSWDGLAGVQVRRWVAARAPIGGGGEPVAFTLGVLGRRNGAGTENYRVGHELQVNLTGAWPLAPGLSFIGQLNSRWRRKDDVGRTDGEADHTGGTAVYATPGLRVGMSAVALYGYVQTRLYERVNGIQITAPVHLVLGTNYSF